MNTDASDFLGGLRPARRADENEDGENQKLFEWQDGPLVRAMLSGDALLVDEISLADDSVLERINSVLETDRVLVVPERADGDAEAEVTARADFLLVATMNPGGDFGKKELSPALRNRFSEVWCSSLYDRSDSEVVLAHLLPPEMSAMAAPLSDLAHWLNAELAPHGTRIKPRDLRTLADFVAKAASPADGVLSAESAVVHGENQFDLALETTCPTANFSLQLQAWWWWTASRCLTPWARTRPG